MRSVTNDSAVADGPQGDIYTCHVRFRRPRVVVPSEMERDFSELNMSPGIPPYDVCLSSTDCAKSTLQCCVKVV